MQLGDLKAIVADRKRERLALGVKLPRQIQKQVGHRLVIVGAVNDPRQRRCRDALAAAVFVRYPMRARAHCDCLRVSRDAGFDHGAALAKRLRRVAHLPPVDELPGDRR
jgi:hypothetical protein